MAGALRHRSPANSARGQALPLLLVVLALAAAAAVVVVEATRAASEATTAQTAADAAALAGAADGPVAASALAAANGATLLEFRATGRRVEVTVVHRRVQASAAAEAMGSRPAAGSVDRFDLAPVVRAALARVEQLLGSAVLVVGYDPAELAIEVSPALVDRLLEVAPAAGLCQPLPEGDPVHFEPCPPTRP